MGKASNSKVSGIMMHVFAGLTVIMAIVIGVGLGLSLAETANIKNQENFFDFTPALPTKILDIDGNLITEFSADEKRALVSLNDLPKHLIHAVLAREDPDFYNHKGFSVRGIIRAAFGRLTGNNLGGGSTITQQIAGLLYTNRSEITISRKIRELWWAFQMERRYTKNEILEIYLNQINMGPGVYGVEASSEYFFGHSAREVTLAEAAMLAILPSSPSRYNPVNNPNDARDRQIYVLDRMIEFGYTTPEEAALSFEEYWDNYDYTRVSTAAYYNRADAAPWFSEYVRRELDGMMYGTMDYYRDGLTVHTTLNMKHQEAAEKYMAEGLAKANTEYARSSGNRLVDAERTWIPIIDMLSVMFDLNAIHATSDAQNEQKAMNRYNNTINPMLDLLALAFGIPELQPITAQGFANLKLSTEQNKVEGALITIENDTGYITAIVGGSKYDESNQLIRATQGSLQPGSSFKPLYYSAAIDTRRFTPATVINDMPIVFFNEDGTPYIPLNFLGEWNGSVLLTDALSQSMNVASIRVLDSIGFDAAIGRASTLLGYSDPDDIRRRFPRVYPLGLGLISTSPLRMARAFSIFANQGREVTPIAIRYLEDRNGKVVLDIERDLRLEQRRKGNAIQVISPQNAYVMTSMLKRTLENGPTGWGTLYNPSGWGSKFTFRDENGRNFRMPMAGKTGTPQNWSDAWTIGFSAYYTTAVWFGFDKPGNSLGLSLTGSTLAGPVWADYMREIHQGLPYRDFARPSTGVVDVTICAKSGLLPTSLCNDGEITLTFLEGTQPILPCDYHGNSRGMETFGNIVFNSMFLDAGSVISSLQMPVLRDEEIIRGLNAPRSQSSQNATTTPGYTFPSLQLPNLLDNPAATASPQAATEIPTISDSQEEPVTEPRQLAAVSQPPASSPSASQPAQPAEPAAEETPEPQSANTSPTAPALQQAPPLQENSPPAEIVTINAPPDEEGLEPPLYNPFLD
jgi:penicillin-binding protein 1A